MKTKKKEQSNRVRTRGVYVVWLEINQSSYMGDVGEKMDQYEPTISISLSRTNPNVLVYSKTCA